MRSSQTVSQIYVEVVYSQLRAAKKGIFIQERLFAIKMFYRYASFFHKIMLCLFSFWLSFSPPRKWKVLKKAVY